MSSRLMLMIRKSRNTSTVCLRCSRNRHHSIYSHLIPICIQSSSISTSVLRLQKNEIDAPSPPTSSSSSSPSHSSSPSPPLISSRLKALFSSTSSSKKASPSPAPSPKISEDPADPLSLSNRKFQNLNRIKMAGKRAAAGAVEAERNKLRNRALKSRAVENQKRVMTSRSMREERLANEQKHGGIGKKEASTAFTSSRRYRSAGLSSNPLNKDLEVFFSLENRLDTMLEESRGIKTLAARIRARAQKYATQERQEAQKKQIQVLKSKDYGKKSDEEVDLLAKMGTEVGSDDSSGVGIPGLVAETWGKDSLKPSSESGFSLPSEQSVQELKRDPPAHLNGVYSFAARAPTPIPSLPASFSRRNPSSVRERGNRPTILVYGEEVNSLKRVVDPISSNLVNGMTETDISRLDPNQLEARERAKTWSDIRHGKLSGLDIPVEKVQPLREMKVPPLAHGLDRVLFNPGVYWLRDPRSGIYNFDPHLRKVLDVDLFDYTALPPYITSSKDEELVELTRRHQRRFCGSTSSMTSVLSQCYFLLSGSKPPDTSGFSAPFDAFPPGFSVGAKLPASILLRYNPPVDASSSSTYAIDSDKSSSGELENSNYVLTQLGKSMEKLLTSSPEEYERYTRIRSSEVGEEEREKKESYHYAMTDKLMMRSQLDCQDSRLPRKTFDLKTRAVVAVRSDRANWVEASGYQIRYSHGLMESFEREYFDMVRAAFLKYSFQARIGHMDGIFVAYHNTAALFGFQYIPLEEMNKRIFGSTEMAEQAFRLSLALMERTLEVATELFPNETLKMTFETPDPSLEKRDSDTMTVFIEPASPELPSEASSSESSESASSTDASPSGEEMASSEQKPNKRSRTVAQLEVRVDRYLDGGLVQGPVDFTATPGRSIDPTTEDEIEKRIREALPPVKWEVDYSITPLATPEAEIKKNLHRLRQRQKKLNVFTLPNVEAINIRERERETELAKNPEALIQFLEDRISGVAAGMPRAPGQIEPTDRSTIIKALQQEGESHEDVEERLTEEAMAKIASLDSKAAETLPPASLAIWRKLSVADQRMRRMRELARLGAQDAKEREANDKLELYQRRDP